MLFKDQAGRSCVKNVYVLYLMGHMPIPLNLNHAWHLYK